MSKYSSKPQLGTLRRRVVSLLTALTFLVLAVTGVIAFIQPFSIGIIGLHALMGFIFIGLIALHILNNSRPLKSYLHSRALWVTLAVTVVLTLLFWLQPPPVKTVLGWSGNLGPAMERFEMNEDEMVFDYRPSPEYKMRLTVKTGPSYHTNPPPQVAIWLENQGGYHIKTLLAPANNTGELPYWAFKHAGWEKAKRDAEKLGEIDAVSSPTPNGSFDPADYVLPAAAKDSTPYSLLLEINQPGDNQPSLVHTVEIDNRLPRTFQLLELRGYPKREADGEKETWGLYFVDESFTSALDLIDSALLTIQRRISSEQAID
ncbi:hypothetical protein FEM03_06590 [Phragmitibacter flavus]|uniref:DUF4405 domain-containing protein n=1 Tax=Phragmitibacter flavus TaxID=2576071 RepID=A0A5R8KHU0_9BACT|nr:hypothetical protein [Phragmitibacter flavus]TLD71801.1 hypothetical protein FEM03_06590 [Phragmitibacter flavus]